MAERASQEGSAHDGADVLALGLAACLTLTATMAWFAAFSMRILWLGLCTVAGVLAVRRVLGPRRTFPITSRARTLAVAPVFASGLLATSAVLAFRSQETAWFAQSPAIRCITFTVLIALGLSVLVHRHAAARGWYGPSMLFILAFVILAWGWLANNPTEIDVAQVLRESSEAALRGENPYAMTYASHVPTALSDYYYGPGYVVDGRVPYGFPYPPVVLLFAILGHLLGDVRIAGLLALTAAALILRGRGTDRTRTLLGLCLLVAPGVISVLSNGWTESVTILFLTGFAAAASSGRFALAAILLGAMLVSKQYFVVTLPLLWMLRGYATRQRVELMVGAGAALILPFFLIDPYHFVRSFVGAQMAWALRPDSLSFAALLYNDLGLSPPTDIGLMSVGLAFLAACILAWRGRAGLDSYIICVGCTLLVMLLTSKLAFVNYFVFVASCFLVGAWMASRTPVEGKPSRSTGPAVRDSHAIETAT